MSVSGRSMGISRLFVSFMSNGGPCKMLQHDCKAIYKDSVSLTCRFFMCGCGSNQSPSGQSYCGFSF